MTLHPEARSWLDMVAALGEPPLADQTPDEARQRSRSRRRPPTEPIRDVHDLDAGGVPARLYRPVDADDLGLLVYFHGGGWVLGDLDGHDHVCRSLANRSGAMVLSVSYRLAPEHPFPAGLEDAVTVTRWAHDHASTLGADAARLAIGGDSAGANLATIVGHLAPAPLTFQLLVYPITDARGGSQSFVDNADGYYLTAASMRWFIGHYLSGGAGSADDPRISPLLADDHALTAGPPALVITAGYDPLRDEGEAYARRLMDVGVRTTLTRYPGMFHGFFTQGAFLEDARRALAEAGDALRSALG